MQKENVINVFGTPKTYFLAKKRTHIFVLLNKKILLVISQNEIF
jgi:hypothetical protein